MERSKRGRSTTRKTETAAKSPGRGRPRKSPAKPAKPAATRARSRGRPRKSQERDVKSPKTKSRERSRSRSVSQTRRPSRSRRVKKDDTPSDDDEPLSDKMDMPQLRINDIMKNRNLDEIIRQSVERELQRTENLRRSARVTERFAKQLEITKTNDGWKKETLTSSKTTIKSSSVISRKEFGGTLGALTMCVALAVLVFTLILACTKEQCLLSGFHIPRNWRYYLNLQTALGVLAFILAQTMFLLLPIGRVVQCSSNASYRANGILALLLTGAGIAALWYKDYPVTITYERHVQATTAAYGVSLFLALVLYIKGGRAPVTGLNLYGNSGSRIYDFIAGREINPMLFGRINVKILCLRCCVIGTTVLDCLLALKGYEVRKEWSPTLLTLDALKLLYTLDVLWFEDSFASTFESQYEGVGLMEIQGLLLYPFYTATLPRFVLTYRIERPPWVLAVSVVWFIIGYVVYRASNLQKAVFRKNPLDPAVAKYDTISTSRGKKLLVSGWWGIVKHPNYLGDIILHWAIATTIGFTHAVPYVIPLITTLFLLHRARRDAARCSERYGEAWAEYDRRVPYKVIPYVY